MELSRLLLSCGHNVILDATFLKREHRLQARGVAQSAGAIFRIIDCNASEKLLEERLALRTKAGTDASDADLPILRQQMKTAEPLDLDEMTDTVRLDMDDPPNPTDLINLCKPG
jgi:predicted kinase